ARRRKTPDILRHAAPWLARFDPEQPHLVGVSGGRDSVALLHALVARGYRRLIVCHLDHRLRPDSGDDARFVAGLANALNLRAEIGRENVAARASRKKQSLETAAREARHAFFAKIARRQNCPRLFLAHHADDQVETFLFNLFRGAGSAGLGAIRPLTANADGIEIARPLLAVWREEIDEYIAAHGLEFREDISNLDPRFTRNRLRHEIIPALSAAFGRDVRRAVWRAAELLRDEDEFFGELLASEDVPREMSVRSLREKPVALQRRLLQRWLKGRGIANVGFDEVEAVRALLAGSRAKANLPGAWHARRNRGRIFLQPPAGGASKKQNLSS
ncbi:MAG TPA: tRNA lysidine(34) synthetase TilS, partial [Chthoniobacteraceae bacterium]|nr:tRNA lysidine(34) synthetase TilS [Chthoniobacteraceae bacterium]